MFNHAAHLLITITRVITFRKGDRFGHTNTHTHTDPWSALYIRKTVDNCVMCVAMHRMTRGLRLDCALLWGSNETQNLHGLLMKSEKTTIANNKNKHTHTHSRMHAYTVGYEEKQHPL